MERTLEKVLPQNLASRFEMPLLLSVSIVIMIGYPKIGLEVWASWLNHGQKSGQTFSDNFSDILINIKHPVLLGGTSILGGRGGGLGSGLMFGGKVWGKVTK